MFIMPTTRIGCGNNNNNNITHSRNNNNNNIPYTQKYYNSNNYIVTTSYCTHFALFCFLTRALVLETMTKFLRVFCFIHWPTTRPTANNDVYVLTTMRFTRCVSWPTESEAQTSQNEPSDGIESETLALLVSSGVSEIEIGVGHKSN